MCDVEQKKMDLESLEHELTELKETLAAKQSELDSFELDNDKYAAQWDECLNEGGYVYVAGIAFNPSRVLKELDPIAYRCGLNDYVDGLDKGNDEDYKELSSEVQAIQDTVDNLVSRIEELKEEILEEDPEAFADNNN